MPRLPLARTYRPQRFAEVLGQQVPVRALGAAAAKGDIASSYIFSGTRGIGKTTIARLFAKALNCEAGPAEDCCNACPACSEITEGRAMDVLELDAATHTGIDDIRELREAAQYPPGRDRYRIFILDEAHQLSTSAWNGLLKILEEPPPWCVFIFCTTEPHKIPQTIESRALHFAFRSPTAAQIKDHLKAIGGREGIEIDDDALDLLVQAADGSVRDGLSALDQVRALVPGRITRDGVREALGLVPGEAVSRFIAAIGAGNPAEALEVVALLDEEGHDLRSFTADLLGRVHKLAVAKALGAGPNHDPTLAAAAAPFSLELLVWAGKILDETESRLRSGGAQRALLDLAAVRLTQMAGLTPLAELVDRIGSSGRSGPGGAGGPGGSDSGPRPGGGTAGAPPRRFGPGSVRTSPGDRPAGLDAPASDPSAPSAPPAVLSEVGPGLLEALISRLEESKPVLAGHLKTAQVIRAEFTAPGTLLLELPAGKGMFAARLAQPASLDALKEAAALASGASVGEVHIRAKNGANGCAETGGNGRPSRQETFERARKDPLVRLLLDRFGAVFVEGRPLD